MRHLAWRVAGVALTGVALLGYDAQSPSPVHLLLLPMTMALGAWLIIRNATVVLTALTALAAIHSEPSSPSWVMARAYPAVALLGGASLIGIGAQRFRRHVRDTRGARWQHRALRNAPSASRKAAE